MEYGHRGIQLRSFFSELVRPESKLRPICIYGAVVVFQARCDADIKRRIEELESYIDTGRPRKGQ